MNITCKNRRLTPKEQIFCNEFLAHMELELNDRIKTACQIAGCSSGVFRHESVQNEINTRLKSIEDHKIASAQEVLEFYTSAMRGEILDSFGLDPSLDTRLKAADALAKRVVDTKEQDNTFEIHLIRE